MIESTSDPRIDFVNSLTARLLLGFILVSVIAVGLVAVLANQVTAREFQLYVSRGRQGRAERLAPLFAQYYTQNSSWAGVETLVTSVSLAADLNRREPGASFGPGAGRSRPGMLPGMMFGGATDRLVLTDAQGRIVADSAGQLKDKTISSADLDNGAPITLNGTRVGTLLIAASGPVSSPLENDFLHQVNHALVLGGLGAGLIAIILGFLLARQLTAPLRVLTAAAERMSHGDLSQRVTVKGTSEVVELGQAFNEMSASLSRQETLRRSLLADTAHELRNPLSVIRGDLEAMLDGVYEATPDKLASLHEETLLLSRLVDDVRALSLAEAGQLQLKRERVSLRDVLSIAATNFAPLAEIQGVQLQWQPTADALEADVDSQRVQQIVANLLTNALHHTPSGGTITLSAGNGRNGVEISVADTGPGIAPENLPHVFDRFWRGNTVRQSDSSGLGLAIVRGLAQAHGGAAWAESTVGRGSSFYVSLPRRRPPEVPKTPEV
jgi:two-component system, OmpR family, sensor kinase